MTELMRNEVAAALGQQRCHVDDKEARHLWEVGAMVPHRITIALDLHQLYNPEVDEACGAVEPDVDRWEAGDLYPTWQQVLLLSALTRFPPRFFFLPVNPEPLLTSLVWHMPNVPPPKPPVVAFKPQAYTAQPTPKQETLW